MWRLARWTLLIYYSEPDGGYFSFSLCRLISNSRSAAVHEKIQVLCDEVNPYIVKPARDTTAVQTLGSSFGGSDYGLECVQI